MNDMACQNPVTMWFSPSDHVSRHPRLPIPGPARRSSHRGPYRNPMQTGMTVTYLLLGLLDPRFLIGAVVAVSYGAGLAAWHEDVQLRDLHGPAWTGYRSAVRPWPPRARPYAGMPAAVVWIAGGCGTAVRSA
jgi:hypothetical protein